jgi:hypothetical protein
MGRDNVSRDTPDNLSCPCRLAHFKEDTPRTLPLDDVDSRRRRDSSARGNSVVRSVEIFH